MKTDDGRRDAQFSEFIGLAMQFAEGPDILWHHAFGSLIESEDPTLMVKLLRRHIPPSPYYCEQLADLFDPAKTDYGQLSFKKSKAFRDLERKNDLYSLGDMVLRFEDWGEKRYVAVQKVAKLSGVTERYVWKALSKLEDFRKKISLQYEAEADTEQS